MIRKLILLIACATPLLGACTPAQVTAFKAIVAQKARDAQSTHPTTCEEDMPCWNCTTQGNGICGPVCIDIAHHTVIAANGTFPYITLHLYPYSGNGQSWITYAVDGYRPYAPQRGITMLAATHTCILR